MTLLVFLTHTYTLYTFLKSPCVFHGQILIYDGIKLILKICIDNGNYLLTDVDMSSVCEVHFFSQPINFFVF